ncbi:MAG: LysM peptidoglycan-binding domain-containing protein [Actinomycetota bacterium]|nr:LysM peptidoglycan-binding domain-containing protein [Actinomycetota bacterium]
MTLGWFGSRIFPSPAWEAAIGGGPRQECVAIYEPDQPSFGEERTTNVLWGRVIALGVVLLLAFFLGRVSAGGGSSEEVDTLRDQLSAARAQIEQLERENQQAQAQAQAQEEESPSPTTGAGTASPRATGTSSPSPTGAATEQTYRVRAGDTLTRIATRFYGNAQLDDCIARANNIDNASQLRTGLELRIPPRDSC